MYAPAYRQLRHLSRLLTNEMVIIKLFLMAVIAALPVSSIDVTISGVGTVRGSTQVRFGKVLDSFWGIPYAEPPVGDLRFAPTKPAKPWTGIRNATYTRIVCPQFVSSSKKYIGREDCLYLNIFRPRSVSKRILPVLFWVHGGSFIQGSGFSYNGDILASMYNIVVVTVNYRLGLLGFFNVPGSKTSGNLGLLDQIQALKWVKQHISEFGGDPAQVTIAGLSAGGASVSLLALSPLTKGLFNRVIAQSGSPISTWAIHKIANDSFPQKFATQLGCKDASTVQSCLRAAPWLNIIKLQFKLPDAMDNLAPFVDKHVITEYPYKQYMEGRLSPKLDVDLMIGFTKDEGGMFVRKPFTYAGLKEFIRRGLRWNYGSSVAIGTELASFRYQKYKMQSDKDFRKPMKIFTDDFYFKRDIMNFASAWAKMVKKTYVYEFTYLPVHRRFPQWGVAHAIEKAFVFGHPLRHVGDPWRRNNLVSNYTEQDEIFSTNVMKMWTDFVKTGNPHRDWPQFDAVRRRYFQIDINSTAKENFNPEMMKFWNTHIPAVLKLASDRGCKSADNPRSSSTFLTVSLYSQLVAFVFCLVPLSLSRG